METLKNILIMVLFFVLATNPTTGDIGDSCLDGQRCGSGELCVHGFCLCERRSKLTLKQSMAYDYSMKARCDTRSTSFMDKDLCANRTNSPLGQLFTCAAFNLHSHCVNDVCVCNDDYYRIGTQCQKDVTLVSRPLGKCGTSYSPRKSLLCDIEKRLTCRNEKCMCFDKHIPDLFKKVCEPEADYLKRKNLTEYRGVAGKYCRDDKYCLEGLECKNYKCQCPEDCRFLRKGNFYFCDCGDTEQDIAGPCFTGIFFGLIIILCWRWKIKDTIKSYEKLTETQEPEEFEETPAPSYLRQPPVPAAAASTAPSNLATDIYWEPVVGPSPNIQPPDSKNSHYPLNPTVDATSSPVNSGQPASFSMDEPPPPYSALFSQPAENPNYPHPYIPLPTTPSRPHNPAQNQPIASGPSYPLNPPVSGPSAPPL